MRPAGATRASPSRRHPGHSRATGPSSMGIVERIASARSATNSVNTPSRILLIQTIHRSDHQQMPSTKRAAPTVYPDAAKYARIHTAANRPL